MDNPTYPAFNTELAQPGSVLVQLRAQNDLLRGLFRLSAQLAAASVAPNFAVSAARMMVDTVPGLDLVGLWLYQQPDDQLRLAALEGSAGMPTLDPERRAALALRRDEGVAGVVLSTGQPLLLSDSAALERMVLYLDSQQAEILGPFVAQLPSSLTLIALPLHLGALPVGVLELYDITSDANLDTDELPLLQAFADQFAVVVHNAHLYNELSIQHRRLQAVDAVVRAITSASDLSDMLTQALAVTLQMSEANHGWIALLGNQGPQVAVSHGMPPDPFGPGAPIDADDPLIAEIRRTDLPAMYAMPDTPPWSALRADGFDSVALIPLPAGGTLVGVMAIVPATPQLHELDHPTLLALGSQIGIAIANNQLYNSSQRQRRRLASVIESIAEGVIFYDREGVLVLSNLAAESLLGHRLEIGMPIRELASLLAFRSLDGAPLAFESTPLARCLYGDRYQNHEVRVTSGTGDDIVISCSGAPLVADGGVMDGAVVVFRDMTAYKRHEALRDEFLAVAAHELRAPLAAVKGYTDLLVQRERQRPNASPSDQRGLMLLSRQIDHLVRLVDNLLDVSRLDDGRLELYLQPADLVALVEASIDRISIGDNNHTFVFNGPPSLPIVCDQLRLQQVFTNLLSNAARYSAAGTQIAVELWSDVCGYDEAGELCVGGTMPCVIVAVRDQGVGMTPEVQARAFDRYYRANTATAASGLGLGMYLSREIVLRHHGKIWLESTPGVGSTFYVMLPTELPGATVRSR